jgi:hypothetical protein
LPVRREGHTMYGTTMAVQDSQATAAAYLP